MFKLNQSQNKNSFRRGVFFGLGMIVAGLSYAVVTTLSIVDKDDDANDSSGRLTASEFNQIPAVLQEVSTDSGNFGLGIDPTAKLHVAGNILATGELNVGGNVNLIGEIITEGAITANNLRSKCEAGYALRGFSGTGALVCVEMAVGDGGGLGEVNLEADPLSVEVGDSTTLTWTSAGMVSCAADWTEATTTSGSEVLTDLQETNTYTIACVDDVDEQLSAEVTVEVSIGLVGEDLDPDATVPGVPTGLQGVAGNTQATLSWSPPANNGGAFITQYDLNRRLMEGPWTLLEDVTSSYTDLGLNNDVRYDYEVRAVNAVGASAWSSIESVVPTAGPVSLPGTPISFTATAGVEQITLNWQQGPGGDPTSYELRRSGLGVPVYSGSNTTYINTGLVAGTTYSYTIKAINDAGSSNWTAPVSAIPEEGDTVPAVVSVFTGTAGNEQVTLDWSAPADGGSPITGYRIEGYAGGTWSLITNQNAASRQYIHTGLTNGDTYQYRIRASNAFGDGNWSATRTVVLEVQPSLTLSITPGIISANQFPLPDVTVTWSSEGTIYCTPHEIAMYDLPSEPWTYSNATSGSANVNDNILGFEDGFWTNTSVEFSMTCHTIDGLQVTDSVEVIYEPYIASVELRSPHGTSPVNYGDSVMIKWSAYHNDGPCDVSWDNQAVGGAFFGRGFIENVTQNTNFTISCEAPGGTAFYADTIQVGNFPGINTMNINTTPILDANYGVGFNASWGAVPGAQRYDIEETHIDDTGTAYDSTSINGTSRIFTSYTNYKAEPFTNPPVVLPPPPDNCMYRSIVVEAYDSPLLGQGNLVGTGSTSICEIGQQ
ncbi:fibronectin type III domain-containing protein [Candidatus Gracilibacteria bacterium]|nr:fibronectin type III domain-containing protein [Candidatus Gracilibacteria bacterium]